MGKPSLLVLHGKTNFDMPTFAESDPVRDVFDIVDKRRKVVGDPDLVYCQSYTQCLDQLKKWQGPCVVPLGGTMDFKSEERTRLLGEVLTQNRNRTLVFMNEWLMRDFRNRGLDCGKGARLTYLPRGHWGMDHTIAGVQIGRFKEKKDYSLGDPPTVLMSLTLSTSIRLGNWRKCLGIPIFLEAARQATAKHGARLVCAGRKKGDFPHAGVWERCYGLVHVRSHYKDDAVDGWPDVLSSADVLVHPSMYDGWPRVPAEGMCSAVPTMAFDIGGVSAMADTLLTCDPDDPGGVARMLDDLLGSEELRREVGKRQRAEALELTERHRGDLARVLLGALEAGR